MAEYAKYSEPSPQWLQFISQYPEVDSIHTVSLHDRRRILDDVAASVPRRQPPPAEAGDHDVAVRTFTIKARDGYDLPVRSYVPDGGDNTTSRPLLVYLHAGGFVFGDLESGDLNCRTLASKLNLAVLNVHYRLAPRWPFPHGVNDSYDAVVWAAENAETHLSASPAKGFLVGGISSGANFAAVVAYTARDAGLSPPISGLFVSIPVGLMPQAYHLVPFEWTSRLLSLDQNGEAPLLTKRSLAQIEDIYQSPPDDVRISFMLNKDHTNLPKRAYFQVCGLDPLRDETFLWRDLLRKYSGTRSKTHMYSGLPHGFWRFLQIQASREWLDDLLEGIRFLLLSEEELEHAEDTQLILKGV